MTNARVEKENQHRQARPGLGASRRPRSATSAAATRWRASRATQAQYAAAWSRRRSELEPRRPAARSRTRWCARSSGASAAELEVRALRRAARPDAARAGRATRAPGLARPSSTTASSRSGTRSWPRRSSAPTASSRTARPPELGLRSTPRSGEHGTWAYNFLWSRAGTIYAGSSEIQKNIIGERVLRLPKEPRADRRRELTRWTSPSPTIRSCCSNSVRASSSTSSASPPTCAR